MVHRVASSRAYSDGLHTVSWEWTTGELVEAMRILDYQESQQSNNQPDMPRYPR